MSGFVVRPYDLLVGGLLMRGTYASIVELLATTVPTNGTVVDIGTGPGRLPIGLAHRRPDLTVIGVDPSTDMLDRARSLPLADTSVDAVVSSLSSHHWADAKTALAEQTRVLKFGGRFWLFDLKRHIADDIRASVARSGLTLLDEPSPLGRGSRRRFAVVSAIKPD